MFHSTPAWLRTLLTSPTACKKWSTYTSRSDSVSDPYPQNQASTACDPLITPSYCASTASSESGQSRMPAKNSSRLRLSKTESIVVAAGETEVCGRYGTALTVALPLAGRGFFVLREVRLFGPLAPGPTPLRIFCSLAFCFLTAVMAGCSADEVDFDTSGSKRVAHFVVEGSSSLHIASRRTSKPLNCQPS